MLLVAYIASRKQETRPISFGILWFFIALIPTSSFVPLAEVMNDHRMFFPFIGLMLAVCWTLGLFIIRSEQMLVKNSFVGAVVIIALLSILTGHAFGTYQRNKVWRTEESLWHDVTIKSPGNGRGLMNYGLTQMEKGNYQKALEYFERALTLTPHYSYLHVNLAILKDVLNQPVEAERYFRNALQYDPNNPESYYFYARWLTGRNRAEEAVPLLRQALQLSPAHSSAQSLLNQVLSHAAQGNTKTAKTGTTPEYYLNLSLQHHNAGRYQDSVDACKEALKIKPDYDLAYNNICAAYNELKMWDKAIEACEKGIGLNQDNQLLKNNLARARSQKVLQHKDR
jgi:protein O-mannosyl-transferase